MALDFDNDNGGVGQTTYAHLVLPTPAVLAPPFTFASWVRIESVGSINSTLINVTRSTSQGFGGSHHYMLAIANDGRVFMQSIAGFGPLVTAYGPSTIVTGQWVHIAGVVASTTSMKCFLNGIPGTENTDDGGTLTLGETLIGVALQTSGEWNKPFIGCAGYDYIWGVALSDAQIASLADGAPPDEIEPGSIIVQLDMLTVATAGSNPAGTDFTVFDPVGVLTQCASEPPIIEPEPPAPETPGNPGYFIERMDNRIWPTIEDAWCLDAALELPQPAPDATLELSSATGDQSITEYNIIQGGSGYTSPQAQIQDLMGTGSGALCSLGVSGGVITSATALTIGEGYRHPVLSVLDSTGAGAVIQPIVTNYVTASTNTSSFTASDVGSIIRVGGGRAEVITVSTVTTAIVNVLVPITNTIPNDPLNTPVPAASGQWTMTAPVSTVGGLWHLEGLTVSALADGGVVNDLVVEDGSVTLPYSASQILVGLRYTAQAQTMYLDAGAGPTVQSRRKGITQAVLRVEGSRPPEIGINQPDSAVQPNQAEIDWGAYPYTSMTQIVTRTPFIPAGQPVPLYSGDYPISNVFGTMDERGQIAIQQRDPVPLTLTAVVLWVQLGDSPGQ